MFLDLSDVFSSLNQSVAALSFVSLMGESFFLQFERNLVAEIILVAQILVALTLAAQDGSKIIVLFVHKYG